MREMLDVLADVTRCLQENSAGNSQMEEEDDEADIIKAKKKVVNCEHGAVLKRLQQRNSKLLNRNRLLKKQLDLQQICKNCIEFRRERDFLFRKCKNYERQLEQIGSKDGEDPSSVLRRKLEDAEKEIARLAETVTRLSSSQREADRAEERKEKSETAVNDAVREQREAAAVPKREIEDPPPTADAPVEVPCLESENVRIKSEVPDAVLQSCGENDGNEMGENENTQPEMNDDDRGMPFHEYIDARYEMEHEPYEEENNTKNPQLVQAMTENIENVDVNNLHGTRLPMMWAQVDAATTPLVSFGGNSQLGNPEPENEPRDKMVCQWVETGGKACCHEFATASQLLNHAKAKHVLSLKPDRCICAWDNCRRGEPFPCRKALGSHLRSHICYKLLRCGYPGCTKAFRCRYTLQKHESTHVHAAVDRPTVVEERFECLFGGCGREFPDAIELRCHVRTHADPTPYVCSFDGCEMRFAELWDFEAHTETHVNSGSFTKPRDLEAHAETRVSSSSCTKPRDSEALAENHVGSSVAVLEKENQTAAEEIRGDAVEENMIDIDHLQGDLEILMPKEEPPDKPTIAPKPVSRDELPINVDAEEGLEVGREVILQELQLEDASRPDLVESTALEEDRPIDNVRSVRNGDLLEPVVMLSRLPEPEVYICGWDRKDMAEESCGASFGFRDGMVAHVMTEHVGDHVPNAFYACLWRDCRSRGQTFRLRSNLVSHLRVHLRPEGSEPLRCDFSGCGFSAASKDSLAKHRQTHKTPRDRVLCPMQGCGREFSRRDTAVEHYRTVHLGDTRFKCPNPGCGRIFTKSSTLRAHGHKCRKGSGARGSHGWSRKNTDERNDVETRLVPENSLNVTQLADDKRSALSNDRGESGNIASRHDERRPDGRLKKSYKRIRPFSAGGSDERSRERCASVDGPKTNSYKRIRPFSDSGSDERNWEKRASVDDPRKNGYKRIRPFEEQRGGASRRDEHGSVSIGEAERGPLCERPIPDRATHQRPDPRHEQSSRVERNSSTDGPLAKSNGESNNSPHPEHLTGNRPVTDGSRAQTMTIGIGDRQWGQVERGRWAKITNPGCSEGPSLVKRSETVSRDRTSHAGPIRKLSVPNVDAWKNAFADGSPGKSNTTDGRSHIWPVSYGRRRSFPTDSQTWIPIGHTMAIDTRPLPNNAFQKALETRFGALPPQRRNGYHEDRSFKVPFTRSEPCRTSPTKKTYAPISPARPICPNRTVVASSFEKVPNQPSPNVRVCAGNGPTMIENSYGCPYAGCGQTFKNSGDRAVHRRQAHPR